MNAPLFFENAGDDRATPQKFFDALNTEFSFDLDAAADERNHKCEMYFGSGGIALDALEEEWGGEDTNVFLNPPYSVAGAFVAKARQQADKGVRVVLLLPVRSDNRWWHRYIWDEKDGVDGNFRPGVRFRFIPGRLQFELNVPLDVRAWIKSEHASIESKHPGPLAPPFYVQYLKDMVAATGLPKMAIERILQDMPDEDLLESAPFPSCVVIFEKVS